MKQKVKRIISMLLLSIMLITMIEPSKTVEAVAKLVVHFIDVGQGDAILIQYHKKNVLVDTGEERNYDQLSGYLDSIHVSKIHTMVLTHPDADHCGAADLVIQNYNVSTVVMTEYESKSNEYKEILQAIKTYKVKRCNVEAGSSVDIGGLEAKVLSADSNASNANDSSIVLMLVYNATSFLFVGDISAKLENELVDQYDVNVDVLKVSHHGSDYSSAIRFMFVSTLSWQFIFLFFCDVVFAVFLQKCVYEYSP